MLGMFFKNASAKKKAQKEHVRAWREHRRPDPFPGPMHVGAVLLEEQRRPALMTRVPIHLALLCVDVEGYSPLRVDG